MRALQLTEDQSLKILLRLFTVSHTPVLCAVSNLHKLLKNLYIQEEPPCGSFD